MTPAFKFSTLNLALVCERTRVSDRSPAKMISLVLQEYGFVCADSDENVIDRNKLEDAGMMLEKTQMQVQKLTQHGSKVFTLMEDQTLINENKGDIYPKRSII